MPSTESCTSAARLSGLPGSPRSVTTTSPVLPPAADRDEVRSGPSTDLTAAILRSRASRAATACAVWMRECELTSTSSVAGPCRPEADSRASARPDSPVPEPESDSVRIPASGPAAMHATIRASQSASGVFGRRAALRAAAWTKRASRPWPAIPPDVVDEGLVFMSPTLTPQSAEIAGASGRPARGGPPYVGGGITPPAARTEHGVSPRLRVGRDASARGQQPLGGDRRSFDPARDRARVRRRLGRGPRAAADRRAPTHLDLARDLGDHRLQPGPDREHGSDGPVRRPAGLPARARLRR